MNSKEIITELEKLDIAPFNLGNEDYDVDAIETIVGPIVEIYSRGGIEGGGDYAERVYHFPDHDVYLQITGFYSSYHGTDWEEGFKEVRPKEKMITIYE